MASPTPLRDVAWFGVIVCTKFADSAVLISIDYVLVTGVPMIHPLLEPLAFFLLMV